MAGNDLMLAGLWKGLNRRIAPYLLPEAQSPDTTDAGSDLNVIGLLGPRRGRTRIFNRDFNITGVGSCNFPWGRQRVVVTNDGKWENFAVPWPAMIVPTTILTPVENPFAIVTSPLLQVGVGINNDFDDPFGPYDTSSYSRIYFIPFDDLDSNSLIATAGTTAIARIQAKINGTYYTIFNTTTVGNVFTNVNIGPVLPSGNLTDIRTQLEVTAGAGTATLVFSGRIILDTGIF